MKRHAGGPLPNPAIGPVTSAAGLERPPLQPAVGALQGAVDIVIAGIPRASVSFGNGHFVVDVGVLMAKASSTGRASSPSFLVAEPASHAKKLLSTEGAGTTVYALAAKGCNCNFRGWIFLMRSVACFAEQMTRHARFFVQLRNPGITPKQITACLRPQNVFASLPQRGVRGFCEAAR
jgi:hypothetical protein